jgi:hypothetical protein
VKARLRVTAPQLKREVDVQARDGWPALPPNHRGRPPPLGVALLSLGAGVGPADVPALCEQLAGLVRDGRPAMVVCDVSEIIEPDAGTLDALARLQLAARRLGCTLRLYRAGRRLRALLAFTGLDEVLPAHGGPADPAGVAGSAGVAGPAGLAGVAGLAVEAGRQAEEGEDPVGVQEGADPPDPAG